MDSNLNKIEEDARKRVMERLAIGLSVGLQALSLRMLTVLALLLNSGIFAWCLLDPRWERLVAATVFALFSYSLIHVKPKQGDGNA